MKIKLVFIMAMFPFLFGCTTTQRSFDSVSVEEFQKRCKVSQTLVDKMKVMGILNNMPETSQLSLF